MSSFVYFAYGSNMLTQRLTARCPGAVALGAARVDDYAVSYSLLSEDGSSKAALQAAPGETAWGVAFEMRSGELGILDGFEGEPILYRRREIRINLRETGACEALTYLPQPVHLNAMCRPYFWYRALCVGGARQHELPDAAIDLLEAGQDEQMPEPDAPAWEGYRIALAALTGAGLSLPDPVASR